MTIMDTLAIEKLSYNATTGKFEPKKLTGSLFIKGPLPLGWIIAANSLPGKSGAVGLAIWFLVGVKCTRSVKLTRQVEQIAACHRKAVYTAITSLEQAGLLRVERHRGARPTVTVISNSTI